MLNKIRIYPYKMRSNSVLALQRSLQTLGKDCLRIRHNGTYRPKQDHLVINWGATQPAIPLTQTNTDYLNKSGAVQLASNKLCTVQALHHLPIISWTISKETALGWLHQGYKVYCRTTLTGHSGSGIVVANTADELVQAPLYTKGIDVDKEYRIHVFDGKVIDVTQKKRRNGVESSDLIRNHSNGWVFARIDVEASDEVKELAVNAVTGLGLDFGACDIVIDAEGNPYLLEVNTAPGLEGTTLKKYTEAIIDYMERN